MMRSTDTRDRLERIHELYSKAADQIGRCASSEVRDSRDDPHSGGGGGGGGPPVGVDMSAALAQILDGGRATPLFAMPPGGPGGGGGGNAFMQMMMAAMMEGGGLGQGNAPFPSFHEEEEEEEEEKEGEEAEEEEEEEEEEEDDDDDDDIPSLVSETDYYYADP